MIEPLKVPSPKNPSKDKVNKEDSKSSNHKTHNDRSNEDRKSSSHKTHNDRSHEDRKSLSHKTHNDRSHEDKKSSSHKTHNDRSHEERKSSHHKSYNDRSNEKNIYEIKHTQSQSVHFNINRIKVENKYEKYKNPNEPSKSRPDHSTEKPAPKIEKNSKSLVDIIIPPPILPEENIITLEEYQKLSPLDDRKWIPDIKIDTNGPNNLRIVSYKLSCSSMNAKSSKMTQEDVDRLFHMNYENRRQKTINELKELNGDLLCLQEIERDDVFEKSMEAMGYEVKYLY